MTVNSDGMTSTTGMRRATFVGPASVVVALILAIALIRLVTLGAYPLFDNTEARYALVGRLMYETGNWITPFIEPGRPFWAKPPLSIWTTAASYVVFGVSEFSARLPSFIVFLCTGLLMSAVVPVRGDRALGSLAVLIFLTTGLGFYLSGAVMTDPAIMLAVAITMVGFWKRMSGSPLAWGYVFFLGLAFSMLAKELVGIALCGVGIGAWVAWHGKWRETWERLPWLSGTLLTLALALPWYIVAEARTPGFLRYFIVGEHFSRFLIKDWGGDLYGAPRTRPLGTIWLFALVGTLPWSGVLAGMALMPRLRTQVFNRRLITDEWQSYMLCWFLAGLVFFTLSKAVLMPYVAMSLPPFALLTAMALQQVQIAGGRAVLATAMVVPVVFLGIVTALRAFPTSPLLLTQAHIIAQFNREAGANTHELVYFPDRPNSAQFYSDGRAKAVHDAAALASLLDNQGTRVAVRKRWLASLPADLRAKLVEVADLNGTLLFRPRAAGEREGSH